MGSEMCIRDRVKAVLLAGGLGTRLREETEYRPKPMVEVGGRPILWHIMKGFAHHGITDFVVCTGYRGEVIKDFFLNYEGRTHDFTVRLGQPPELTYHSAHEEDGWQVTVADTGQSTMTGGRVKRIQQHIGDERCMVTYGDGLADVDLSARHPHQVAAGELLGAGTAASGEYDVVVDAAGTSSAVATAIDHARPGGLLSAPAVYWDPLTIPNAVTLVVKEVRVQPSYTYGHHHGVREVDEAAALLGIVPELAGAVVTHRFGLDDAPEAFRVAADRASGAIKVVLEP